MNLSNILKNSKVLEVCGDKSTEITGICYDSRRVGKNCLFVCLKGVNFDGHDFIEDAIKNGAVAIASEKKVDIGKELSKKVSFIYVEDTRRFLAEASVNFFGRPAEKLTTIAITGTKGKTTTSIMIKSILEQAGHKVGLIGTLGIIIGENKIISNNTTPESYEIQKSFSDMVAAGCDYAVFEASSIGLKNHRLDGIVFDYGVFTNLSSDHIGAYEHKNIDEYIMCKSMLFKKCKMGLVNMDDIHCDEILKDHTCKVKTFGFNDKADYKASGLNLVNESGKVGVGFNTSGFLNAKDFFVSIPGKFNVYNAIAAIAVCHSIDVSEESMKKGIAETKVRGRVEPVNISSDFSLFIDYAHNAVSMENVLLTLKEYKPKRLVAVFGAGGDRPKVRRYEMGEVSGKISDLTVITSDNPRTEEPLKIIEDIKTGIDKTDGKYIVIPDRKEAIKYCIQNAQKGDIIVLAGKGHEDYQEINHVKYPFDERKVIADILSCEIKK